MKLFPSRVELAIFGAMALIAGAMVTLAGQHDTMLFLVTVPVFLVSALMGFRRSLVTDDGKSTDDSEPAL